MFKHTNMFCNQKRKKTMCNLKPLFSELFTVHYKKLKANRKHYRKSHSCALNPCKGNAFLGCISTSISFCFSSIIVRCIVIGGYHDITVARCESVAIGIVQMACPCSVASRVVSELGH